jgi:hypothetical protein
MPLTAIDEALLLDASAPIRDAIRALLARRGVLAFTHVADGAVGYYHTNGNHSSELYFTGCYKGRYFGVETRLAKKPTSERQSKIMAHIDRAGGWAALFSSIGEVKWLDEFFDAVDKQ